MCDAMASRAQAHEIGDACDANATFHREEMVTVDYVPFLHREAKSAGLACIAVYFSPLRDNEGVPTAEPDRLVLLETFLDAIIIYRREGLRNELFHQRLGGIPAWKASPTPAQGYVPSQS